MTDDQRAQALLNSLEKLNPPCIKEDAITQAFAAVRAAERERCAMVADDHDCTTYKEACPCTSLIAQRIREGTPA